MFEARRWSYESRTLLLVVPWKGTNEIKSTIYQKVPSFQEEIGNYLVKNKEDKTLQTLFTAKTTRIYRLIKHKLMQLVIKLP